MQWQQPKVTIGFRDASGSHAEVNAWVNAADWPEAVSAANTFRSLTAALSAAVPVWQKQVFRWEMNPRPVVSGGVGLKSAGLLVFSGPSGTEFTTLNIPALADGVLLYLGPGAYVGMDPANPALLALVDALTSSIWCNPFGDQLVTLEAAYRQDIT